MQTAFSKYEGAGNDFILIDNRHHIFREEAATIARLCDRHFGIGADGLMTLSATDSGSPCMRYYNADGSLGEMCGNGARCFSLFMHHLGIGGEEKEFEATDGRHSALVCSSTGESGIIEIGMIPVEKITSWGEGILSLNTGVPHYVEFTRDLPQIDLCRRGAEIRFDTDRFPQGTNVNFAEITGEGRISMRTYERGVENETLACGTGATAVAIAANYYAQPLCNNFEITLPGGTLFVRFSHTSGTEEYQNIYLKGPARRVFEGKFDITNF